MALINLELRSPQLQKSTRVRIILNQNAKPPYPTYFLLHGLSDDSGQWSRMTRIEQYAEHYPFMVVMPDGGRSFYCDSPVGLVESYIIKDLIPFIDQTFPTRAERRYRAIGGLSMGGYGCMKLGLKYHDTFGVIASHSGALDFAHTDSDGLIANIFDAGTIIDHCVPASDDCYILADKCPKKRRPAIYIDCGKDDFLFDSNNRFVRHLRQIGYPHTYRRFPGEHNWSYWDKHIVDALGFVAAKMKLKKL